MQGWLMHCDDNCPFPSVPVRMRHLIGPFCHRVDRDFVRDQNQPARRASHARWAGYDPIGAPTTMACHPLTRRLALAYAAEACHASPCAGEAGISTV